ncbi:MAG: hypothetical protein K4571_18385 [Deltaproteobacteria bacterium]
MKIRAMIMICLSILLISACAVRKPPAIFVDVYHSSYQPKFDPAAYSEYKGKTIIFVSIANESKNTTMLGYYSADGSVRYTMNYSMGKMPPPVESFLWYTLQKSFAHAGVTATNENVADKLTLLLTLTSLDDREAKFQMQLSRTEKLLIRKEITVAQNLPPTKDIAELESRTYSYIDSMTVAILSDPDFKKEMLTP